eukprot:290459-Hanusia_phi.AAC.2
MRRAEGDCRSSESAMVVASVRKVQVVSKDILSSGDAENFMPMREEERARREAAEEGEGGEDEGWEGGREEEQEESEGASLRGGAA